MMRSGRGRAGGPLLAFDFGGTKMEVALAAPGPQVLARVTLGTRAGDGAEQAVHRALAEARWLLREAGPAAPAAVGVSTMGLTRADGVDLAPNVPGWEKLRLPEIFRREYAGCPVELGNDVRAAARAEVLWGRLAGCGTGVYVNLGTGVAATLIIGGAVFAGGHDAAGEIGYWLDPGTGARLDSGTDPGLEPGPDAASAWARLTTLEAAVGGVGVRHIAAGLGIDGGLAELLASGDPRAAAAAADVITRICLHLTNLAIVIDPEIMVLGGGYTGAGDRILGMLRPMLARYCPFPPEVVIGRFGADVGLYGAVALAESALARTEG